MDWKRWIATCFGLGWLPVAPGTWGSLPPAVVFGLMTWQGASWRATTAVMALMVIAGCATCILCAPASIAARKKEDPGEVVMDEFAAQALTFLATPILLARSLSGPESLFFALAGFLLFRAFDIFKPWPIQRLERLPAGWGVLADDLVAGLASAVVLYVGMKVWITA